MLNLYPYTNGHLLVVPKRHVADFTLLEERESSEMMKGVQMSLTALKKVYDPNGFNVGMNLGQAAGAGVADHLHLHVVPRWNGDTNFVSVVSGTRVLCQALDRTHELLRGVFQSLSRG